MKSTFLFLVASFSSFFSLDTCIILPHRSDAYFSDGSKGPWERQSRDLRNFSSIDLMAAGDVYVTLGENFSVVVEAKRETLEKVKTSVKNGVLQIDFKSGREGWTNWSWQRDAFKVRVTMPRLRAVDLSGSGNIEIKGRGFENKMDLNVSGSGNIKLETLQTQRLTTNLDGSGNIQVASGNVGELWVAVAGSGNINLRDLKAQSAKVELDGSGNVNVYATKDLEIEIGGSGNVTYRGNPSYITKDIDGSGDVRAIR